MIAYEELAAALERWRIRNGLPGTPPLFADGPRKTSAAPASYSAPPAASYSAPPAASYSAPPAASYAAPPVAAPRPGPPMAPPAPAPAPETPETIDEDLADADVLDEDHLDNDGPDFAMSFSGAAPPPAAPRPGFSMTADEAREASLLGSTDPGIVPPPDDEEDGNEVWPEASAYASPDWGQQRPSGQPTDGRASTTVADDDDDDDGGTLVNG